MGELCCQHHNPKFTLVVMLALPVIYSAPHFSRSAPPSPPALCHGPASVAPRTLLHFLTIVHHLLSYCIQPPVPILVAHISFFHPPMQAPIAMRLNISILSAQVEQQVVCLLLSYILVTSKVIWGWVATCDRVNFVSAAPVEDQTTSTMTGYHT